jgi:cytochrome c-type protein NapB
MKAINIVWVALAATIGSANLMAADAIDELNMGLSKGSLLDVPTPEAPAYPTIKPGKSDRLTPTYSTAPPQIPHRVEEYLPITLEDNACMD